MVPWQVWVKKIKLEFRLSAKHIDQVVKFLTDVFVHVEGLDVFERYFPLLVVLNELLVSAERSTAYKLTHLG